MEENTLLDDLKAKLNELKLFGYNNKLPLFATVYIDGKYETVSVVPLDIGAEDDGRIMKLTVSQDKNLKLSYEDTNISKKNRDINAALDKFDML